MTLILFCFCGVLLIIISHRLMRANAVQARQESEERFRVMANAIPQLAWVAKSDGYIFWYNQRWYDYTGTTLDEMEGWGWQSVHDPKVLPKVLEQWKASIATGIPFDMIFPLRAADGQFRPFLTRVMPLKDPSGRVIQWFGTNTDITERKQAEETIHRQNAVLDVINRIFREALSGCTDEDLARNCLAAAEEVTGSKFGFIGEIGADGLLHDTAISDPGCEACAMYDKTGHRRPPGDFKIAGLYGWVLREGRPLLTNRPSEHPDSIGTPAGHPPLTAFLGVPLLENGKTIGMIVVANKEEGYSEHEQEALERLAPVIIEAFSHKRAREAVQKARDELEVRVEERTRDLQHTQEKLMEQSRTLEGFFTSTITPLVLLDRQFNFIRVNRAYAKACQKEIGEFPGHNHFEFYPHAENEAIFKKVVETKVPYQATAKPFSFPDPSRMGHHLLGLDPHPPSRHSRGSGVPCVLAGGCDRPGADRPTTQAGTKAGSTWHSLRRYRSRFQ